MNCLECNQEFADDSSLHRHFRAHSLTIEEYYKKHFPKFDLYDKSPIVFKNKDQYFTCDFNNKNNLKAWIKTTDPKLTSEYFKKFLSLRKEKKHLVYSLSQVECRSLPLPSIVKLHEIFGDYYEICKSLGFINKYQYPAFEAENNPKKAKKGEIIYVDTREQKPFIFNFPTEKRALKWGDYAFSKEDKKIYFERKSISDLIGTLSGGYERFEKEIERASAAECKLIIIVEEKFTNALAFNYLPHVYKKSSKVTPEYIFRRIRDLIQKYPHIQFLFADGRKESTRIIEKIFSSSINYFDYDLQLCYDLKIL